MAAAQSQAEIKFITGRHEEIVFAIYNLLGKQVFTRRISAQRGINTISLDASDFSKGIYLYSLNNKEQLLTKTMFVTH